MHSDESVIVLVDVAVSWNLFFLRHFRSDAVRFEVYDNVLNTKKIIIFIYIYHEKCQCNRLIKKYKKLSVQINKNLHKIE